MRWAHSAALRHTEGEQLVEIGGVKYLLLARIPQYTVAQHLLEYLRTSIGSAVCELIEG